VFVLFLGGGMIVGFDKKVKDEVINFRVIKRSGEVVEFDKLKIVAAIKSAFISVEGDGAANSDRVDLSANQVAHGVMDRFVNRRDAGSVIHIEDIQDKVELVLLQQNFHEVALSYIKYRHQRNEIRAKDLLDKQANSKEVSIKVNKNGKNIDVTESLLKEYITVVCEGLDVDVNKITKESFRSIYDGVSFEEYTQALVLSARSMVEINPEYSLAASRLLRHSLLEAVDDFFDLNCIKSKIDIKDLYKKAFVCLIKHGVEFGLIDKRLKSFDLEKIANAIVPKRDYLIEYLGMQTLYDRYFQHKDGVRIELPQTFFMRVAMGLAINEGKDKEDRAIEFYNVMSKLDYMSSTPTLFNSGTQRPQLSSCFLTTIPDDLDGIYSSIKDNALLSKFAGGIGNDWTRVRGMGSLIKGTNGKSLGVVPFMNVADATAVAVNQGGKRKGAVCGYLETWHLDIEEFLELRKNTGDERRRTHDMNTANWIPDLFMQRVFEKGEWTLFSPNDVPDLHELYGQEFNAAYVAYEEQVREGKLFGKVISAQSLWRKMLGMLFETGHPWLTWKDACNIRSPQQHVGVIHSSNLCTEITLNTNDDEIAVCNLGSINLPQHVDEFGNLDQEKLKATTKTVVRMLDNVIDINYYTVPQAKNSNLKHRPVGLGVMGFQDALYKKGISYNSEDAINFADQSMEFISYFAINASIELAKERGAYNSYSGSLWDRGILPIDSIKLLKQSRNNNYCDMDESTTLDWESLRSKLQKYKIRNSNILAIAPTATISNICGVSQSIEPTYQNLFVKSNMSGEFTIVNKYLVKELKKLSLWDESMVNDIKYHDGSLQKISRIPEAIKSIFITAFEVDPHVLIKAAAKRQKWIDQAQSLNLYMAQPSGKKLDVLYRTAWSMGLKTTYYLRSMGISHAEKSTIADGALNAVKKAEVCNLEEGCEACQ
jgi:ribonucleoside-diphosphate reductase alpha chain